MSEIEIKGIQYRLGTLDAMKQFHVFRRIAPLLKVFGQPTIEESDAGKRFEAIAQPLAEAIADMPDETSEYIINTCLAVVQRGIANGGWAPVISRQKQLMYNDIDMTTMLRLTMEVIQENMAGFFSSDLPTLVGQGKAAASG